MQTQPRTNPPSSNNNIISNADRVATLLADLESQMGPNYSANAKKHWLVCTTLMRRYTGKTVSNHEATTEHRQALNATQKGTTRACSAVGDLLYTPNTCDSPKPRRRDIWRLFRKVLDNAIYSPSRNAFENDVFTKY